MYFLRDNLVTNLTYLQYEQFRYRKKLIQKDCGFDWDENKMVIQGFHGCVQYGLYVGVVTHTRDIYVCCHTLCVCVCVCV